MKKLLAQFLDEDNFKAVDLYHGDEISWINMKGEKFTGAAYEVEGDCVHVKTENGTDAVSVFTKDNICVDMVNGRIITIQ